MLSVVVLSTALLAGAVDRSKFRTCDDTGFCKKFRHYEKQEREVSIFSLLPTGDIVDCLLVKFVLSMYPHIHGFYRAIY